MFKDSISSACFENQLQRGAVNYYVDYFEVT